MSLPVRLLIAVFCIAVASAARAEQSNARTRDISQVAGDLYKVTDGDKATVFLVGDTSILLADPLSAEFVRWLRMEVETRFPGRRIRYVVPSSHQYDRAAGGSAFFKEGEVIAHEAFSSLRRRAARSLPPSWAVFDSNKNKVLDGSESSALGSEAVAKDLNNDGVLTGGEVWSDVSGPETTYGRRHVVEFEGRRVELIHPGDGLGADLTLLLFPKERVLFAPGVPLRETPNSLAPAAPAFIDALRQIERLEFDRLLSGTGEMHTLSDLAAVREYAEAVVNGVKGGIRVGHAVEELQASMDLAQFSQLRNFDMRRGRNIEEVYRGLRLITVGAYGAAQVMHLQRGVPDCALNAVPTFVVECIGVGGSTMSGVGAADVMVGRIGGAFEFSQSGLVRGTEQRFISRPTYFESRETGMAYMFRYEAGRIPGITTVVTGGFTRLTVKQKADGPYFFSYPSGFEVERSKTIPVFGVDLTVSKGPLKFVAPIRVMHEPAEFFSEVGGTASKWSIRAGIGIGGNVATLVH